MKAVQFEGSNCTFVAPGCDDLPAARVGGQIITTWEMSIDEVRKLLQGGKVRLSVLGGAHPPVMPWVE